MQSTSPILKYPTILANLILFQKFLKKKWSLKWSSVDPVQILCRTHQVQRSHLSKIWCPLFVGNLVTTKMTTKKLLGNLRPLTICPATKVTHEIFTDDHKKVPRYLMTTFLIYTHTFT